MSLAEQPNATIDWKTVVSVAEGLGRVTLLHVARRDVGAVQDWCLRMSRVHVGEGNAVRALSYLELAVLTGHQEEEVDGLVRRLAELEKAAEQLLASVRLQVKAAAQELAKTAATEKAA
jgi:hypothetical protein